MFCDRMATTYVAPSSPGDLADRWTIMKLKVVKAPTEEGRRAALKRLHDLPLPQWYPEASALVDVLGSVNERLWELEDRVRALIADPGYDRDDFIAAARTIPILNDVRAHLKGRIDLLMGCEPADVKMYA